MSISHLIGGLEHETYFSIQLGMSSSQLMNSYFSEGLKSPTRHAHILMYRLWTVYNYKKYDDKSDNDCNDNHSHDDNINLDMLCIYIYIYRHCLYCIVWHSMMLIYIYIYSVYPGKGVLQWDISWDLNGIKLQHGDWTGLIRMEFKTSKMTCGDLRKGSILYIYPIYGNLNAECDDSPVASGARYFSDKGISWGKTLLSSRYSQQNQSSDYGFCLFFPKYKVHMNKTGFLEKHTRNTW